MRRSDQHGAHSYTRSVVSARSKSLSRRPGPTSGCPPIGGRLSAGLRGERLTELLQARPGSGAGPDPSQKLVEGTLWLVLEIVEARQSETLPRRTSFRREVRPWSLLSTASTRADLCRRPSCLARVRQAVGQLIDALVADEEAARLEDLRWAADAERLFAAEAELRLESDAAPSDLDLAAHLSWPVGRVAQLRRAVDEARTQHDVELMNILGEIETS